MEQYVVHKGVYCQVHKAGWRVKRWRSEATGQQELMAWPRRIYVPLGDYDDPAVKAVEVDQSGTELEKERLEAQRLKGLAKSAARAKRNCRYKIKSAAFGSLLTCTYRENQTSFDKVRADWAAMLRKLKRVLPGFRAVYAFEPQERGAWHVHAAIDSLPKWINVNGHPVRSWELLRQLWRSVVGADNGNIDVDGHRKTRHGIPGKFKQPESLARLAGYVSKYLTKDYENGIEGRNRWGSTQGLDAGEAVIFDMPDMPLAELIGIAFQREEGHTIAAHRVGRFGDFWCLYTEPDLGTAPGIP